MTDDLVTYLSDRLDEEEQATLDAIGPDPDTWFDDRRGQVFAAVKPLDDPDRCPEHLPGVPNTCDDETVIVALDTVDDRDLIAARGEHSARWNPDRVLAEIEAKRRIMAHHHPQRLDLQQYEPQACAVCVYDDAKTEMYPCPTLRALAQPYAERDDFRDEWRL